jgi:nucleotide-binding universal stress UspA family protein
MKRILIAVDDTKNSEAVLSTFQNLVRDTESVTLLYVERLEGRSLMIDMLGEAELSTLKESLEGTEHKEVLDIKSQNIIAYYEMKLHDTGTFGLTKVIRFGHPSDEILKVADEEKVDLILLGYKGHKGLNRLFTGSVVKDVEKNAKVPVLLAKRPLACEEPYSWRDAYAAITITSAIVFCMFILGVILQGIT